MKQNKITYQAAILMLKNKVHQAPNKWEQLEDELTLNDNLSNLKKHKAPDDIWSRIETELEVEMPQKVSPLYGKFATGLIVIIILTYLTGQFFGSENVESNFVYKSEVEVINSELPEIESNSIAYKNGIHFIELNQGIFSEENYSAYQKELKDLDMAITKIKMMQEEYGQDASSLKMLSKLERQKADLIKSIISRA